jgi:hypothetical protein
VNDAEGPFPRRLASGDDRRSLAALRGQFTRAASTTTDDEAGVSARYRAEDRLRSDLKRERRLRYSELRERVQAQQANLATSLELHRERTLTEVERELREAMETELAQEGREAFAREEARLRDEYEARLSRELEVLRQRFEVETDRRMQEERDRLAEDLRQQLEQEHQQRVELMRQRLDLEHRQRLHRRIQAFEEELQEEMNQRFVALEDAELTRLRDEQDAQLAERESQLRHGIRTRLEQQLRQRLSLREAALRAEYARRSQRLEANLAVEIQEELEQRLRRETEALEARMREDVELSIARRRDELRREVEVQLQQQFSERLADRKSRLRERYDLTYGNAVEEVEQALRLQVEADLEQRNEDDYARYQAARESEIQNRLARFRYEREAEIRAELEEQYAAKRTEWTERLELEFQSREAAARKAILSEVDSSLRNERLSWDTDLDLLKEETVLELELDMEERLNAFRERKMDEVATQLERQLDKREEIMRNKALIDVRRKEARIRAEIEGQLGLKRAEIRDRIAGLSKKMDEFKAMAEERMRESITSQVEGEVASEEDRLAEREAEFARLQDTDARMDKRQQWLSSISGQSVGGLGATADASTLGARPDALGASAGRSSLTALAQAAEAQPARMGLAGMRAPTSTVRTLAPSAPVPIVKPVKQVKSPVVAPVREPVGNALETLEHATELDPPASVLEVEVPDVHMPEPEVEVSDVETSETEVDVVELVAEPEVPGSIEDQMMAVSDELEAELLEDMMEEVQGVLDSIVEVDIHEATVQPDAAIDAIPIDAPVLQPIRTMQPAGGPAATARLKPAMPVLGVAADPVPTVLQPVHTLRPLRLPSATSEEPSDDA